MDKYNETTKEQRKMAMGVAADVLKTMRYLRIREHHGYLFTPKSFQGKPVQEATNTELKECVVCARGAMFISRCKLFNVYCFPELFNSSEVVLESTAKDFGSENSRFIEAAFESSWEPGDDYRYYHKCGLALVFGGLRRDPRRRLRDIMRNVIENGGVFRPDKDQRVIREVEKQEALIAERKRRSTTNISP